MRAVAGVVLCALVVPGGAAFAFPWSRDLKDQVSIKTQEMPLAPPAGSVRRTGEEIVPADDVAADKLVSAVPYSPQSAARGQKAYMTWCIACHGVTAVGNGPVAAKFMPPPDLHGPVTVARSDGFIYAHIRRGGPLMPSYRYAIDAHTAWDLVNYIRSIQRGARP